MAKTARDLLRKLISDAGRARVLSAKQVVGLVAQLGEDEKQAIRRIYREKKMRQFKTDDLEELVDRLGQTYDKGYRDTVEEMLRGPGRPKGSKSKTKVIPKH